MIVNRLAEHSLRLRELSLGLARAGALCSVSNSYGYYFGRKPRPDAHHPRREILAFWCNIRARPLAD